MLCRTKSCVGIRQVGTTWTFPIVGGPLTGLLLPVQSPPTRHSGEKARVTRLQPTRTSVPPSEDVLASSLPGAAADPSPAASPRRHWSSRVLAPPTLPVGSPGGLPPPPPPRPVSEEGLRGGDLPTEAQCEADRGPPASRARVVDRRRSPLVSPKAQNTHNKYTNMSMDEMFLYCR